ncbi:MAG: hypothetical protein AB7N71_07855 [Phycisphaerae bacterium]
MKRKPFALRVSMFALLGIAWNASAQSTSRAVFVVHNGNLEGSVTAFRINSDASLDFVNRVITGSRPTSTQPCSGCNAYEASLSPSGKYLATSHPSGTLDGVTIFEVAADATITQIFRLELDTSVGGPLDLVWMSEDLLAVTRLDTTPDRIAVYAWNPGTPSLSQLGIALNGNGLSYLLVDHEYSTLYANSSSDRTVAAYDIGAAGGLSLIEAESTGTPFPLELAITPDDAFVYAAGGISNGGDKVMGFSRQPDGSLDGLPGTPFVSPGASPSNVFASGDGEYLLVGHGTDATVRVLDIDTATGALTDTGFMFDVGGQGTLGDVAALDDLVFVTDNSTSSDGVRGLYVFKLGPDGALDQVGPLYDTGGIAPRSIAVWGGLGGLVGDVNCDGVVSVADIGAFVLALTDPVGYAAQFPDCDINNADVNDDGMVSVGDIGMFVALLTN